MDTRIALKENTILKSETFGYTIWKEIARGGSCIVYDAVYTAENGDKKPVRLKECYPFHLNICRKETGELIPSEDEAVSFAWAKSSLRKAFHDGNELFLTGGLTNVTSNMLQCFDANNTVYIPSAYLEGKTLSADTFSSLKDCISIVKTVAAVIENIHKAGYLYLDLKPENVFVLTNAEGKGATELVQLFDFDSLVELSCLKEPGMRNLRLSFTQGFAALEHQMGQVRKLGFHTDVYSVGALLFYLIFGKAPGAKDCEEAAEYDFEHSKYGDLKYQDRLFIELTEFFHKTLANFYPDRYQSMGETVEKLGKLVERADLTVPFVFSSKVAVGKNFVGREEELRALREWFDSQEKACLFLTGMGGIGKSTLVRKFLLENGACMDTALYVYFRDSMQRVLTDDEQIQVNTVEQSVEEKECDYFNRKLKMLKKILAGKKSLLVIDNFSGEIGQDFVRILSVGWKVLVISREAPPSESYEQISLEALREKEELHRLFENYAGRGISENEKLDSIIERVHGHTLALELIAKQVQKSHLTLAEAELLMKKSGFSGMAAEKVRYEKDYETRRGTIRDVISAVFDYEEKNTEKSRLLKTLSLFEQPGVELRVFEEMLELKSGDSINELCDGGWISLTDEQLSMHPVIQEAVSGWEWSGEYLEAAGKVMDFLYKWMKLEGEQEEYPLPLLRRNERARESAGMSTGTVRWMEKYFDKNGITGEIVKERTLRGDVQRPTDYRKVRRLLQLAEGVLLNCRKVEALRGRETYTNLLGCTVMNLPFDREETILRYAEELLQDGACRNGYMRMRVYKKVAAIYNERGDFAKTQEILGEIRAFIRGYDHYVKAEYYDILADFYDARLDGQYDTDNEFGDLENLKKAVDRSLWHMNLSHGIRKKLKLIEYTLAKVRILIRSTLEKEREIRRLLSRTEAWLDKYTQPYSKLRLEYHMSAAWYYTLCLPDLTQVEQHCRTASAIARETCATELDYMDLVLVPYANMMAEFEELQKSKNMLELCIGLCGRYPGVGAYERKKMELYGYLMEVVYYSGDREECRRVVERIMQENRRNSGKGIEVEIPGEIVEFCAEGEIDNS